MSLGINIANVAINLPILIVDGLLVELKLKS